MLEGRLIDDKSDRNGLIDYLWSHTLASDEFRELSMQICLEGSLHYASLACEKVTISIIKKMREINFVNLYSPGCDHRLQMVRLYSYIDHNLKI